MKSIKIYTFSVLQVTKISDLMVNEKSRDILRRIMIWNLNDGKGMNGE